MTSDIVEIREDLKSRRLKGTYKPHMIRLRPGLTTMEKALTLAHEMRHHVFYTETSVGRLCAHFFNPKFTVTYTVLMFLAWLFFPAVYVFLIMLPTIDRCHELLVSAKYPGRISFTLSALAIFGLLFLFWLRLRI
jgi:hypothetical protein